MFKRWHEAKETEPPNMIGIMNLFMVLIPFLLMGAAFFHVAVIPSSLPTHTPQSSDVPKTPKTVTVNLVIEPGRLKLSGSSTSLSDEQLAQLAVELPSKGDKYPLAELTARLKEIKAEYPMSNTMIVLPHPKLNYEGLVTVLDASRDYVIGKDPAGEPLRADLFPVVVFSRFVPPPPEPEPGTEPQEGEGGEGGEGGGEPAPDEEGAP